MSAAVATALVASSAVVALMQATPSYANTTVEVWLTTPDKKNKLDLQLDENKKPVVAFGSAGSGDVITVNPKTTYQSIVGFGGSLTHAAAHNIKDSSSRDKIMKDLFGSDGISLSFLRQPIGTSDFAVAASDPAPGKRFYSLDDTQRPRPDKPPSSDNWPPADPDLSEFSIEKDEEDIIPLLQQARTLNPDLTVMASPWSAPGWMKTSPPGWMKTSSELIGGSLKEGNESVFAKYLTKFVQEYDRKGIPITYLTSENEPQSWNKKYPYMPMGSAQESTVINALEAELRKAKFGTKILAFDHNWQDKDGGFKQPLEVLRSDAGSKIAGVAWHSYMGPVENQTKVRDLFPSKEVVQTEGSWEFWKKVVPREWGQQINQQGGKRAINTLRNWSRTVAFWNLALDPKGGPMEGNPCECTAPVTTNGKKDATYNAEYYVLGHFSKFVKPGAVRIDSNVIGKGINNVAFKNTDGTIALVAQNMGSSSKKFQVSYGGSSFGYELPAGAMATFKWPGSSSADGTAGPVIGYQGLCLDVQSAKTAEGTPVLAHNCNGSNAQKWTATTSNTLQALGKCLEVKNAGTTNRTPVQLSKCSNGNPAQVWQHQPNGGYLNPHSEKCLDVTEHGGSGTKLQIWTCTGRANQHWSPWVTH